MIFRFDEVYDYKYLLKNKLQKINRKSQSYKDYKKNILNAKIKLTKTYASNINDKFIRRICKDRLNKIIFYGMNSDINYNELASIIIYRKTTANSKKIRFVIMLIAVHPEVRNVGYGKITLNEFINFIYKKNKKLEIFLHSLDTSLYFYFNFGFKKINKNNFIQNYEGVEDDEEEFHILKYVI